METSTIALIIVIVTLVLYATDKFPIPLISLLSVASMVLLGVMPFGDAFKGFSGNTFIMVASMMVIGHALIENGVVQMVGTRVFHRFANDERKLLIAFMAFAAVTSAFIHNSAVMIMMMPIIEYYVRKSGGKLHSKIFDMPVAQSIIMGTRLALVGSASPILAQEILLSTEGVERGFRFFETARVAAPVLVVLFLCYYYIIYPFMYKRFGCDALEEVVPMTEEEELQKSQITWKTWMCSVIIVLVALGLAFTDTLKTWIPNLNTATVSLCGALLLLFSGCIKFKKALKELDLDTLVILGCATGFATCFTMSGIGDAVVNKVLEIGGVATNPVLLVAVFTIIPCLLINLVANSVATAAFAAVAIPLAQGLGISPLPFVAGILFGGGCSFLFPTSTYTLTMAMTHGKYKFNDYVIIGAMVGVICCITAIIGICAVYGLF